MVRGKYLSFEEARKAGLLDQFAKKFPRQTPRQADDVRDADEVAPPLPPMTLLIVYQWPRQRDTGPLLHRMDDDK